MSFGDESCGCDRIIYFPVNTNAVAIVGTTGPTYAAATPGSVMRHTARRAAVTVATAEISVAEVLPAHADVPLVCCS